VAAASRAPVLNMQCDVYHPFQILADLMTIMEKKGDPRGKTIAVSYAYASSYQKPLSVPQDLILLMSRFGMNVRLVHPPEFKLMPDIVQQAMDNARKAGGSLEVMDDMDAGFKDADIVYPKSWGCWLTTEDKDASAAIGRKYTSWIADERRMALARPDAIYMHCLPADRNIEVADALIDGPQSVVYDEAENRLHVQKAVMALTMS
jgi:ornithine carbamoyltransferase